MFPMYLTLVLMLLLILAVVGTSIYEMVDEYLYRRATDRLLARHYAESHMVWSDVSINHLSYGMYLALGNVHQCIVTYDRRYLSQADGYSG